MTQEGLIVVSELGLVTPLSISGMGWMTPKVLIPLDLQNNSSILQESLPMVFLFLEFGRNFVEEAHGVIQQISPWVILVSEHLERCPFFVSVFHLGPFSF